MAPLIGGSTRHHAMGAQIPTARRVGAAVTRVMYAKSEGPKVRIRSQPSDASAGSVGRPRSGL
eukprot:7023933-Prymnesium_polylepis.1